MALLPVKDVENLILDQLELDDLLSLYCVNQHYRRLVGVYPVFLRLKILYLEEDYAPFLLCRVGRQGDEQLYRLLMGRRNQRDEIEIGFDQACCYNHFRLAQLIKYQYPDIITPTYIQDLLNKFTFASDENYFPLIPWLLSLCSDGNVEELFLQACRDNQVEVAEWLAERYPVWQKPDNYFRWKIIEKGHLAIVQLLERLDPDWQCNVYRRNIEEMDLEVLVWIYQRGKIVDPELIEAYFYACARDECLEGLRLLPPDFRVEWSRYDSYFKQACQDNQQELAEFYFRLQPPRAQKTLQLTIAYAQLDQTIDEKRWLFDLLKK